MVVLSSRVTVDLGGQEECRQVEVVSNDNCETRGEVSNKIGVSEFEGSKNGERRPHNLGGETHTRYVFIEQTATVAWDYGEQQQQ